MLRCTLVSEVASIFKVQSQPCVWGQPHTALPQCPLPSFCSGDRSTWVAAPQEGLGPPATRHRRGQGERMRRGALQATWPGDEARVRVTCHVPTGPPCRIAVVSGTRPGTQPPGSEQPAVMERTATWPVLCWGSGQDGVPQGTSLPSCPAAGRDSGPGEPPVHGLRGLLGPEGTFSLKLAVPAGVTSHTYTSRQAGCVGATAMAQLPWGGRSPPSRPGVGSSRRNITPDTRHGAPRRRLSLPPPVQRGP